MAYARWFGMSGEPAGPPLCSGLDLDQYLTWVDAITLGYMHGLDGAVDCRLDLAFHLHRFADEHRLAGLDLVAFGHQHIDHIAGHTGRDVAGFAGAFAALAASAADELIELFEDNFFRHAIHAQVEMASAVPFDAHTGDIDTVIFTVNVNHELGRHAFGSEWFAVAIRNRQQHFRFQVASGAFFEELAPDIAEHGEGQHVFFAFRQIADFIAQAIHFRFQQIRRAHVDHALVTDGAHLHIRVDGAGRLTVATLQVEFHLVGNGLVALAGQHVEYRLSAHDLRRRCHQWRITEVGAHPRDFIEYVLNTIQRALFLQLVGQVGHHAARYLVDLHPGIHTGEGALELVVFLAYFHEIHADFLDQLQIQAGVIGRALERRDHGFGTRMAGTPGHGADGGIDIVRTALDGLELTHGSQAGGVMGVNEHRQAGSRF